MKRTLITGGSGLLGQYINIEAYSKLNVTTSYHSNTRNCKNYKSLKIDITNINELKSVFDSIKPEIVIHAAAITDSVPKENITTKDYFDTNVTATKNIAELCEQYKAKLIYISTDLVYAGYRGSFLKEDGKLIPATIYGETKLMGELKVKESTENYIILRTALLYGFGLNHSRCHFHIMFDNLKNKKAVKLFIDQYRTPVSLNDASRIICYFARSKITNETINLGGSERVSRCELGEMLCNIAGFDKDLIEKITMDDIPGIPKVEDVSLNTDKVQSYGIKAKSIEENILTLIK